jgi:hypothetical protein
VTGLADLLAGDPEVAQLDQEAANIRKAEAAYRADPALAADFERSGWFPERYDAARRGETVWSEGRTQGEPILKIAPAAGQLQVRPTAWAGFVGLNAEVAQRRAELVERRRPQLLDRLADREAELRAQVLATPVGDLDPLVADANAVLELAVALRGPIRRTVRTPSGLAPARYRERVDAVELVDAAVGGWSLLEPLPADEPATLLIASAGIQRDTSPSPSVAEVQQHAAARYGASRG